ncbi:unnamed protein product, partial [Menidia menidia]
ADTRRDAPHQQLRSRSADWPSSNMLPPLLYMCAAITLTGAAPVSITESTTLSISSCPITFFEKVYTEVYVNVSSTRYYICFDGFFDSSLKRDCIELGRGVSGGTLEVTNAFLLKEAVIKSEVKTITEGMVCTVWFSAVKGGTQLTLLLHSFGNQSVADLHYPTSSQIPMDFQVLVEQYKAATLAVQSSDTDDMVDISGCRYAGIGIVPNTNTEIPENCQVVSCSLNRTVTLTEKCDAWDGCNGGGVCVGKYMCTVTGPTVVDVLGSVSSVEDRCSYALIRNNRLKIEIQGSFRERRRTDVSFLDSLTVTFPRIELHLEQGGRVLKDGVLLDLNSTVQNFEMIDLFKDHTGVHASAKFQGVTVMSLFFDGDTAQIYAEDLVQYGLQYFSGLCVNSSSFSDSKHRQQSSSSCDTPYTEPADSTINCTAVTDRCNLLMDAPFSSCHEEIDPAPYITACSDTLCKYPEVDGLRCQFLGAYAKACSMNNSTLEGWWSEAECPPPTDSCQDQLCSDGAFCGELDGDAVCLCRGTKSSKYRESGTLGDPAVCSEGSATVTFLGCLLREKGIDYSVLHLNDESCKGERDEGNDTVTFSFNSTNPCGVVVTANDSHVTYENTIMSPNASSGVITRQDQISIDFSCTQVQPEMKTVGFRVKDSSVVQHIRSGTLNYTLTMKAFTDAGRTTLVDPNTDVLLNQKVWVELETDGLDGNLVALVIDSCWATSQSSPTSTPSYDLILNGCENPDDRTVDVEKNGEGTLSYFAFKMFDFSGKSGEVYLHCELQLCAKKDNSCIPFPSSRIVQVAVREGGGLPGPSSDVEVQLSSAWPGVIR